jgi:hypothetical protein
MPVAVEKLASEKSAKIKTRQEALQVIFFDQLEIFYPRISTFFGKSEFFNSHACYRQLPWSRRDFYQALRQSDVLGCLRLITEFQLGGPIPDSAAPFVACQKLVRP